MFKVGTGLRRAGTQRSAGLPSGGLPSAFRNATGPRSQRPRRHAGARLNPILPELPQPLRAGTSRAPERDRSLGRSAHEYTLASELNRSLSNYRSAAAGTSRAPERDRSLGRSAHEYTQTPGLTDPSELPQPLRAGTSRAPERDRSLGRSAHEYTQAPGLTRSFPNYRSRCAPGRRAFRSATGPSVAALTKTRRRQVKSDPSELPQPLRAGTSRAPVAAPTKTPCPP